MTVLSFDSVTRGKNKRLTRLKSKRKHVLAYVIEQGLSEVLLGILNGAGSALGIVGTLVYPYFVKRLGLVRTGVIGFWSEFSMLILCLLSLFTHGTLFSPFRDVALGSCHNHEMSNQTAATNFFQFPCVSSKSSVFLLIMGITLNRFGKKSSDALFLCLMNYVCLRRSLDCRFNRQSTTAGTRP